MEMISLKIVSIRYEYLKPFNWVLVGWVLCLMNTCVLFNDKSCLSTNIKPICFVNIYFVGNILNKPELICLYTVKWFQVLLCNTNNSIQYQSIVK